MNRISVLKSTRLLVGSSPVWRNINRGALGATRFHSSSSSSSSSSEKQQQQPPNPNRGKIALDLGLLALGSSIASISYQRGGPTELVEPAKPKKAFKDGEVSVIFILGGPGSGKGTQSAKLVKDHGFVHLSAGDLLRAEQQREGSKYGELIAQYIKDGLIVPQEVTLALLKQAISEKHAQGSTKFLIDGFPRKMDQAISFEEEVATSAFTIFFECPEQVMLERLPSYALTYKTSM